MVRERLIDRETAIRRVEPEQLDQLLHPTLDSQAAPPPIGKGLAASPGAAGGKVVFSAPELFEFMPIHYYFAYGGFDATAIEANANPALGVDMVKTSPML